MAKHVVDEKVLSYNDVVLRQSDLDILSGPHFLNDRIIEFYFSFLGSSHSSEDILLVPPSIAFWIKECLDTATLQEFLKPLNLSKRELIMFPINDNIDVSVAEGGSHWSLLVFKRSANVFVHHDSSSSCINTFHARRLYKAIFPYMPDDVKYMECSSTPKQVNGHDCGLYVIAFTRAIYSWYENTAAKDMKNLWFSELEHITPLAVSEMRGEILGLIKSLMVEH
ncbi:hypothetical protein ACH5RR_020916 [Cinchona calisaya]|uniref:Ubiquitin-like protease family profile domain-containing protein n=1 Tax=Cinchona calisaya TaxID=153742 RepID=A0ABD2ZJM2_9GENT